MAAGSTEGFLRKNNFMEVQDRLGWENRHPAQIRADYSMRFPHRNKPDGTGRLRFFPATKRNA
jgi:hypothetical protein